MGNPFEGPPIMPQEEAPEIGFEETAEMREARSEIREVPDGAYNKWRDLAEAKTDRASDYIGAQIGLLNTEAGIYLRLGNQEAFSQAKSDASEYAYQTYRL